MLRRAVQILSLLLFIALLAGAGAYLALPPDALVRLDPMVFLDTALSARVLLAAFLPAIIVLAATPLLGRAFCGWLCPMGATIDFSDRFLARGRSRPSPGLKHAKTGVLAALLVSAAAGLSLAFTTAPLPLVSRFYGLAVLPGIYFFADKALLAAQPLTSQLGLSGLHYAEVPTPSFATVSFIVAFFALVLLAGRHLPRFWCRCLCPAGAALSLLSHRPLVRRRVSDGCTDCGRCARKCPSGAIDAARPLETDHAECLACLRCRDVCPISAVSFGRAKENTAAFSASRRSVMAGAAVGAGAGALYLAAGPALAAAAPGGNTIRPPGALPEAEFLARCVRCGQCMAACPTNTLQPVWLASGVFGLFSPAATPIIGPCDPRCHACAASCPTRAIRRVGGNERVWMKIGTAKVERKLCLAWEKKKRCLVCDEVCPYGAVVMKPEQGNPVFVPHVEEKKCSGCGYCHHHCPVEGTKAIRVEPKGALRLATGSYEAAGRAEKMELKLVENKVERGFAVPQSAYPDANGGDGTGLPPGFSPDNGDSSGLPPGFSPEE